MESISVFGALLVFGGYGEDAARILEFLRNHKKVIGVPQGDVKQHQVGRVLAWACRQVGDDIVAHEIIDGLFKEGGEEAVLGLPREALIQVARQTLERVDPVLIISMDSAVLSLENLLGVLIRQGDINGASDIGLSLLELIEQREEIYNKSALTKNEIWRSGLFETISLLGESLDDEFKRIVVKSALKRVASRFREGGDGIKIQYRGMSQLSLYYVKEDAEESIYFSPASVSQIESINLKSGRTLQMNDGDNLILFFPNGSKITFFDWCDYFGKDRSYFCLKYAELLFQTR